MWHISVNDEEDTIKSVIENFDISFGSSNAMDTLRTCIPLYGGEIIYLWKNMVKEYPKEIAIKNIRESLQSIDCTQVELYLQRENPTLVYEHIINLQKSIFLILLALNNEYFPTFKWMYKSMETMNIKSKGIEKRFRDAFAYPPRDAFESTKNILLEIFNLINEIYPEINTDIALNKLKSARIAHNEPIII